MTQPMGRDTTTGKITLDCPHGHSVRLIPGARTCLCLGCLAHSVTQHGNPSGMSQTPGVSPMPSFHRTKLQTHHPYNLHCSASDSARIRAAEILRCHTCQNAYTNTGGGKRIGDIGAVHTV